MPSQESAAKEGGLILVHVFLTVGAEPFRVHGHPWWVMPYRAGAACCARFASGSELNGEHFTNLVTCCMLFHTDKPIGLTLAPDPVTGQV
jgi:hypothetical protein